MTYKTIIYEKRGHIAYVTLNRPKVSNVINAQLADELSQVCHRINEDDSIRVVIISGAGNRFFCAGEDLAEFPFIVEEGAVPSLGEPGGWSPASVSSRAVASLHSTVIAAVNGDALDAGLELALSCDIRITAKEAQLGLLSTCWGLIPSGGGTQRLPRIIGKGKALEMLLTAEPIDAPEAYRIGLANKVVPGEELMAQAEGLAKTIISRGPIAVRYAKEAVGKGMDMSLEQGLRLEADLNIILQTTEDRAEGIKAFLEKRRPRFKGQ